MDMLTEEQRRWVYTQQVLQSVRLLTRLKVPPAVAGFDLHPNNVRRFCFRLCVTRKDMLLVEDRKMMGEVFYGDIFGAFIMIIIVSNTIIMLFYAPRATDMSKTLTEFGEAVDVLSNVFAGIYFVEFVIKITGLGPRQYFRYKWNLFDFFLVVVQVCTSVSTAAAYLGGGEYLTLNLSYIRSMRVLRLARYSRSARQLRLQP